MIGNLKLIMKDIRMNINTQKRNAKKFIHTWKYRGQEKQDSQSFWLSLLHEVLEVDEPENFIKFEKKVHLSHDGFIDGYIEQTHVMIEQKGSNKDLDKPIKQSDGSLLNPFQQAQRYSTALPYSKRPRWIVTCNFKEFRVYDMEQPNVEPGKIELKNLVKEYYRLEFLVDKSNQNLVKEEQVSIGAGELVGQIYDELLKQYKDASTEHAQKSINQLCVRIVFCLYAEDSGIFGRRNMFHDYLENFKAQGTRRALIELFKILDTKIADRDPYLADDNPMLAEFPYVNGGMFSDENIEIPSFNEELRNLLLNKASKQFNWSEISPTIFGAVFESTLNPETRRQGGMHYTSIENIHKVIDPLFLNDLKEELNQIKALKQPAKIRTRTIEFQTKLAEIKILDPACGSGNFLTETYLSLRKLENEAIKLRVELSKNGKDILLNTDQHYIQVSIHQFYGIEINDFAVSVAKTALWIAESQMMEETKVIIYFNDDFLPLKTYSNILEGDALKLDWNGVLNSYQCSYVIGNPPFVGKKEQTKEQKNELKHIFVKNFSKLDYVCGWYMKAAKYILGKNIKCAFVSTNSITQGEQVQQLWKPMLDLNMEINFAYKTFAWKNGANNGAHVHVVIIGFHERKKDKINKLIYNESGLPKLVKNINPYLIDAENIIVTGRNKPVSNVPNINYGSMPIDNGNLILDKEARNELLTESGQNKKFIRRYMGGQELLKNKERWCLWLVDATPKEMKNSSFIKNRIYKTKEFRLQSHRKSTVELADSPYLFGENRQTVSQNNEVLVIPKVSSEKRKYVPIVFLDPKIIVNGSALVIKNATKYNFGILTSNVHNAWMRMVAGRMKSDYQYSGSIVYNTFPWPKASEEQKEKISKTAQSILDAREHYPNNSLADLYDPLTLPKELLKAHQANDKAVMNAYGLSIKNTTESDAVSVLFKMYERIVNNES